MLCHVYGKHAVMCRQVFRPLEMFRGRFGDRALDCVAQRAAGARCSRAEATRGCARSPAQHQLQCGVGGAIQQLPERQGEDFNRVN